MTAIISDGTVVAFAVPGTDHTVTYEFDRRGALARLSGRGVDYVVVTDRGERVVGDGLAVVSEAFLGRSALRHVRTACGQQWTEEYRWDDFGRPVLVDGVDMTRDHRGRVVRCVDTVAGGTVWRYVYAGDHLAAIETPAATRYLVAGHDGRPARVRVRAGDGTDRVTDLAYDDTGRRVDAPRLPGAWHRDELGRLWTITDAAGNVTASYLWDRFTCIGRIDGPVGEPLAAAFSVDNTNTPTRVIDVTGPTRIPRDAFGEALLDHAGLPGLFGGAVHAGHVVVGARSLDPHLGAWDAPDPWHGGTDDPRRSGGYAGPLTVERSAAGSYAVCAHDPVGRADPTGTISALLPVLDVTWGYGNNMASIFVLDWFVSFVLSPFFGKAGRFFDFEWLTASDRLGSYGVRRDGMMAVHEDRAWTYTHLVFTTREHMAENDDGCVFVPGATNPFRPELYGSILRMTAGAETVLAAGGRDGADPNVGWSRVGGRGVPVAPGSVVPTFPDGGVLFNRRLPEMRGPKPARLAELTPSAQILTGTFEDRTVVVADGVGLGLNPNDTVLISDLGGAVDIVAVLSATEAGTSTRLVLVRQVRDVAPAIGRVRGIQAQGAAEPLPNVGPDRLDPAAPATGSYAAGDALRLSQGGTEVGARTVTAVEAVLPIDGPVPAAFVAPLVVRRATPGAATQATLTGGNTVLEAFAGNPLPARGEPVAVTDAAGGLRAAAMVVGEPSPTTRTLDRPLTGLPAGPGDVRWRPLAGGTELGRRAGGPEPAATVTYSPQVLRTLPAATDFVIVTDRRGDRAPRAITGPPREALVMNAPLPGALGTPYSVERFRVRPPDRGWTVLGTTTVLGLTTPTAIDGVALRLYAVTGASFAAGPANLIAGASVTPGAADVVATTSTGGLGADPAVGRLVALRAITGGTAGGSASPAVVAELRLTLLLDRTLARDAAAPAGPVEVVPLGADSPAYRAEVVEQTGIGGGSRDRVVLWPMAFEVTAAGAFAAGPVMHDVQFPRFGAGEIVMILHEPAAGGPPTRQYWRVGATDANGALLTLVDGAGPLPGPAAGGRLAVVRMSPTDPGTGTSRAGIRGAFLAPTVASRIDVSAWRPNGIAATAVIGVVDLAVTPNVTRPAVVASVESLALRLAAPVPIAGAVEITLPPVGLTAHASGFAQDGASVVLIDTTPALPSAPTPIVVVPYRETGVVSDGEISPGTVKIPADPEYPEITRRQSLVDHELRHTMQCLYLGPWLLCMFPLFAFDLGLQIAGPAAALPTFSGWLRGSFEADAGSQTHGRVTFEGTAALPFADGNAVQLYRDGYPGRATVKGGVDGRNVRIEANQPVGPGPLLVRRVEGSNWQWFFRIAELLTIGGIGNLVVSGTWGALFHGIAKLVYALGRKIGGAGEMYAVTVGEGGTSLSVTDATARGALRDVSQVLVRHGEATVVRSVTSTLVTEPPGGAAATLAIRLAQPIEWTDDVRVAPYSTHDPESFFDWNDYFPAAVPDATNPSRIRLGSVGSGSDVRRLTLAPFDTVVVKEGSRSQRIRVTNVEGEFVDLETPPPTSGGEQRAFRIAKAGPSDGLGEWDNVLQEHIGNQWVKWVTDPWANLAYTVAPSRGSAGHVLLTSLRYLFSTQSWMLPGFWFWDNVPPQAAEEGERSTMEQDASQQSGDLYSHMGRLNGPVAAGGAVVGDLGRYWFFTTFRQADVYMGDLRDRGGSRVEPTNVGIAVPRIQGSDRDRDTFVDVHFGGAAPADSAVDVPDALFPKDRERPVENTMTTPQGMRSGALAEIPASPRLARAAGTYVAFSRPGAHRVGVDNGVGDAEAVWRAVRATHLLFSVDPNLVYDVNVGDVTVRVAGQEVADGATLTMVLTQQATVEVTPNGSRRYAVAVRRPVDGPSLRLDGTTLVADRTPTVPSGAGADSPEPVEVSRVYAVDGSGRYVDPFLEQYGMHLSRELHVPVRTFRISVTDRLTFLAAPEPGATPVNSATGGSESFLLVPAEVHGPITAVYAPAPPAPMLIVPQPVTPVSAPARAFIGPAGSALRFSWPAPPGPGTVTVSVPVGLPGNTVNLTATISLAP